MENNRLKIIVSAVAAIVILIGSYFVAGQLSSLSKPPAKRAPVKKIKDVNVYAVKNEDVPTILDVDGELVAFDKIDIFAEVSGTLVRTAKPFKVGSYFPKGSVLIQIDREEAELALLSQKSTLLNAITQMMPDLKIDYAESFENWNTYLENFDLNNPIVAFPEPLNKQEKYFIASKNIHAQYYNIKSAEERLEKYTLNAPFSGVITQTSINPGAVVRSGQKLGELMNNRVFELEITVPVSELKYVQMGSSVKLQADGITNEWEGRISRIDNQVDAGTQTVKVFVGLAGNELKEGLYMKGMLQGADIKDAVKLPRALLIDQKEVYVLQDSILKLQPVEVVKITEDEAIIRGLEDGTEILKEIVPGLFDGIKVNVRERNPLSPEVSMQ